MHAPPRWSAPLSAKLLAELRVSSLVTRDCYRAHVRASKSLRIVCVYQSEYVATQTITAQRLVQVRTLRTFPRQLGAISAYPTQLRSVRTLELDQQEQSCPFNRIPWTCDLLDNKKKHFALSTGTGGFLTSCCNIMLARYSRPATVYGLHTECFVLGRADIVL